MSLQCIGDLGENCCGICCIIPPLAKSFIHSSIGSIACEKHQHQLGETLPYRRENPVCDACNIAKGRWSFDKNGELRCVECMKEPYLATELKSFAFTDRIQDIMYAMRIVPEFIVKCVAISNGVSSRCTTVMGYSKVTILVFLKNVVVKAFVLELHDRTFKGYVNHSTKAKKSIYLERNTVQVCLVDTTRRLDMEVNQNKYVMAAVLIGICECFNVKSIHLWMKCPQSSALDYVMPGAGFQRDTGRQPRDLERKQEVLVRFYTTVVNAIKEHRPGLITSQKSQFDLLKKTHSGATHPNPP